MNYIIFLILCGIFGMILYLLGAPLWVLILIGLVFGFLVKRDDDG